MGEWVVGNRIFGLLELWEEMGWWFWVLGFGVVKADMILFVDFVESVGD